MANETNPVAERYFSDFRLGDNVYELASGLIPEIAGRFGIVVGDEPSSAVLQTVMDHVGRNKVLRENAEITAIGRREMANMVDRSGVQKPLNRSLWTPELSARDYADAFVIVSGMANWQDRVGKLATKMPDRPVYSLAGQRVMDSATEKMNDEISRMHGIFGRYPTEAEYAASVVVPQIAMDYNVMATSHPTENGDELARLLFEDNPDLLDQKVAVVRVANAGIVMAIQLRNAARTLRPNFDAEHEPQMFVVTDTLSVARTEAQENEPLKYQKAATALRQIVITAKKLVEIQEAEAA